MARNISKYLKENNLSRTDLAKRLDVGYTTVSDWINAKTYPIIDKIEMMANLWNIQKSYLVEKETTVSDKVNVIAAHIEDDITDEEMDEILNFIDYIKSKRD